jgi:hypothetical protein
VVRVTLQITGDNTERNSKVWLKKSIICLFYGRDGNANFEEWNENINSLRLRSVVLLLPFVPSSKFTSVFIHHICCHSYSLTVSSAIEADQ